MTSVSRQRGAWCLRPVVMAASEVHFAFEEPHFLLSSVSLMVSVLSDPKVRNRNGPFEATDGASCRQWVPVSADTAWTEPCG